MLSAANTALDLLVLELVLHGLCVGVVALVLGILAPVDAGSEDDVLANRRRVGSRAVAILTTGAKLGPGLAVGNARVDGLGVRDVADAARRLHLLPLVVEAECDDCLGSIFIGNSLRGRQLGAGLLDIVVVGPIVPIFTMVGLGIAISCAQRGAGASTLTWTWSVRW